MEIKIYNGKLTYTSGEGVSEYYLSSSHAKQVHESMARDRPNKKKNI